MATLISKNEKLSIDFDARCYTTNDNDMIIVSSSDNLDRAEKWLRKNGLFGIYFNPEYETEKYSNFVFVTLNNNTIAIRLYN